MPGDLAEDARLNTAEYNKRMRAEPAELLAACVAALHSAGASSDGHAPVADGDMRGLNVLVSADKMPSAQGIRVLSAWTSEAAERSLKLAKALDQQFVQLDTTLQSKSAAIVADVRTVESSRRGLLMPRSDDNLRKSRRIEYQEIRCLNDKAAALQERTVDLLQSLRFVDEGSRLLDSLDDILGSLLTLYPKPEKPLDMRAYAVGYTMKEQHAVRDSVFGGEEQPQKTHGRLTEPAEGEDYGANVELF